MKQTLAIIAFSLLCIAGAAANLGLRVARPSAAPDGSNILEFLAANPTRAALWVRRDGQQVADFQSARVMPLASTLKLLIAVEYAEQAASGKLRPSEPVALSALDRYYLPGTDSGAHPGWLKYARGSKLIAGSGADETAQLEEVVCGMLQFSSNASADWLIEKLGAPNIDARAKTLGMKSQTPLYSFVGSVFVSGQHGDKTPAEYAKSLRALPDAEWMRRANEAHQKLRDDASGEFKKAFVFPNSDEQKVWSDRFPAASARDYGAMMSKVNSRQYFKPATQQVLDRVLEWPLQASPQARQAYKHLAFKGGSTAWILTQAFCGETTAGDKVEGAIFFNDLTPAESEKLQAGLDIFIAGLFKDEALREKLKALRYRPIPR
jgi:D-alanyl-D-alanine carboxypeptidase